jgi:CheY-like chemotaxis protein
MLDLQTDTRRPEPARSGPPRVLIMEHDLPLLGLISRTLAAEGYGVLATVDGRRGVALARRLDPSVILLDLALPPTSGFDVLERLHQGDETRYIPVIAIGSERRPAWRGPDLAPSARIDLNQVLVHLERLAGPPPDQPA